MNGKKWVRFGHLQNTMDGMHFPSLCSLSVPLLSTNDVRKSTSEFGDIFGSRYLAPGIR